jgi:hypothetical protein
LLAIEAMSFASQLVTLTWKNSVLKRRHPVSFCFEIWLPVVLVLGFTGLSTLFDTYDVPSGWSAVKFDPTQAVSGSSFDVNSRQYSQYFYTPSLYWNKVDPLFLILAKLQNTPGNLKLGLAPRQEGDSAKIQSFATFMQNWYGGYSIPGLGCPQFSFRFRGFNENPCTPEQVDAVPAFNDVIRIFNSQAEMESYVTAEEYEDGEKIWAGIVFNSAGDAAGDAAPGGWDYAIRVNTTFGQQFALDTQQPPTDNLAHNLNNQNAQVYSEGGFMTLQVMMDRYIMNLEATLADIDGVQQALTDPQRIDYIKGQLATYRLFNTGEEGFTYDFTLFDDPLLLQIATPELHLPM